MKYLKLVLPFLLMLSCSDYPPEDEMVMHFMVNSPSPVTITCYSDQLGQASFSSPGGVWTYDMPIDPPMFYQMVVRSTVLQTINATIWIQEDYDETRMIYVGEQKAIDAANPLIASGPTPTRDTLEDKFSD